MIKEEKRIEFNDCDYTYKIKPYYYFQRFAEIATQDAKESGYYTPEMEGVYGWVVSKQTLKLYSKLTLDDVLTMTTQPMQGTQAIFPRYYIIEKDNHIVGECFSQWTIIDLKKRRIIRSSKLGITIPTTEKMKENPKILHFDEDMEKITTYQVKYSDIDGNQHMNNTQYIRLACDIIPITLFENKYVKEISIHYKKEAKPLSYIDLYYSQQEDIVHVLGKINDEECFLLEMIWENDND